MNSPAIEPPSEEQSPDPFRADRTTCCSQCGDAASKDPSGRDISLNLCSDYIGYVVNGSSVIDARCGAWLREHPLRVQDCN